MRHAESIRAAHGRHARVTWSFIALALMTPACVERTSNSDSETPPVITERGVEITNIDRDEPRRTVLATVSEHGVERRLTLAPLPDGPSPGFVATIEDDDSFFELSLAADEGSGEVWIRERTQADEMTIRIRECNGRVYEGYDINGVAMAFERPALAPAQMDRALARYRAGDMQAAATPGMQELAAVFTAFDAYYTPTMCNTLHDNLEGNLLMSLLEDPVLAMVVTGGDPSPDLEGSERIAEGHTMEAVGHRASG